MHCCLHEKFLYKVGFECQTLQGGDISRKLLKQWLNKYVNVKMKRLNNKKEIHLDGFSCTILM